MIVLKLLLTFIAITTHATTPGYTNETKAKYSLQTLQWEWSLVLTERNAVWSLWRPIISDPGWVPYLSQSLDTVYIAAQQIINCAHAQVSSTVDKPMETWLAQALKLRLQHICEDLKQLAQSQIGVPGDLKAKINLLQKERDNLMSMSETYS